MKVFECECGNTTRQEGFHTCLSTGLLVHEDEWDELHYLCLDCGLIYYEIERVTFISEFVEARNEKFDWS